MIWSNLAACGGTIFGSMDCANFVQFYQVIMVSSDIFSLSKLNAFKHSAPNETNLLARNHVKHFWTHRYPGITAPLWQRVFDYAVASAQCSRSSSLWCVLAKSIMEARNQGDRAIKSGKTGSRNDNTRVNFLDQWFLESERSWSFPFQSQAMKKKDRKRLVINS